MAVWRPDQSEAKGECNGASEAQSFLRANTIRTSEASETIVIDFITINYWLFSTPMHDTWSYLQKLNEELKLRAYSKQTAKACFSKFSINIYKLKLICTHRGLTGTQRGAQGLQQYNYTAERLFID